MLQGKAVSHVRGHELLKFALYVNLLSSELNSRAFDVNGMLLKSLEKVKQAYESLLEEDTISREGI